MKRGILIGVLAICLLIAQFVSAEIFMGQPSSSVYNIGDNFGINITINPNVKETDFLISSLICGDKKIELYRSAHSVDAGGQKNVDIEIGIEPAIIGSIRGECYVESVYGNDKINSRAFEITDEIKVDFDVEGVEFGPNDDVRVSGNAIKRNKQLLDGFVIVDVEGINFSLTERVQGGKFNVSFKVPDNAPSGSYIIKARAYEKSGDEIINEGESSNIIKVKQVLNDINLFFGNLSVIPGNEFHYTIHLYDQSGREVSDDISVEVSKPDKNVFQKVLVKSGVDNNIPIGANYTPGYWKIDVKIKELSDSKLFLVEELEKASFRLENNTLTVSNVGNIKYKRPIEVSIGGVTDVEEVELDIGESKQLRLGAPDGDYDIAVNDGKEKYDLGRTFLTGRVIGIGDVEDVLFGDIGIWVWTLLIVILVIAIFILWRKILKKNYVGRASPKIIFPVKKDIAKEPEIGTAAGGVVDKGVKQEASVVALKIKNLAELQKTVKYGVNPLDDIDKSLLKAKAAGAKIYIDNDYRIMIFSPSITKDKENEIRAISVAKEIDNILQNHNKNSANKIDYGVGIHVGEMAVESAEGKFKFVSLGNTVAIVKRIAEQSKGQLLISEPLHRKTFGKVRVDKLAGTNYWEVKQLMERSNYNEFIQKFLTRQKDEGKKVFK